MVNKAYLDINDFFNPSANNFNTTFFLLLIEGLELALFLPVIQRPDYNLK